LNWKATSNECASVWKRQSKAAREIKTDLFGAIMSAEIVMPQMGESIAEGTITKWLKKVGERVERDEPLFEISTDKVDAEIPAPAAGTLLEIKYNEGDTVTVGTIVALLDDGTGASAPPAPQVAEAAAPIPEAAMVVETVVPPVVLAETPPVPPAASVSAAVEVVMPQMGESIAEGTITKWLKQVGETVGRDEPLFEISTDKVDAEIPSPAGGTLLEIKHGEGETVTIGTIVALIGSAEGAAVSAPAPVATPAPEPPQVQAAAVAAAAPIAVAPVMATGKPLSEQSLEELRRTRSSPLVRNIAKEHNINLLQVTGTGASGRVTRKDIMDFIASGKALSPAAALASAASGAALPVSPATVSSLSPPPVAATAGNNLPPPVAPLPATSDRVEPMSIIRKKIAEHMITSRRTSAHVTTVYEIDMTNVVKQRERAKAAFLQANGTKLTFMPFIFQALCAAIRKFPIVNVQVSGENIIYKSNINLGMAVALDWGLLVPVIKNADNLSLAGLAKAANDLADRARAKKLKPEEVTGGTFTVTNPGVFGGLFGTPIINQPQVAIMGVGAIVKRPMVRTSPEGDDYVAIRSMAYFALTFDHRIIDGADAEKFLSYLKEILENTQFIA
jgi:2-oxoglutarate dehydrogenase E2 component (dihydrolipoamide succinyltransferase)